MFEEHFVTYKNLRFVFHFICKNISEPTKNINGHIFPDIVA